MRKLIMMLLIATIMINVHFKTGLVLYAVFSGSTVVKFVLHIRRRRQERTIKRTYYHQPSIEFEDERYKYD